MQFMKGSNQTRQITVWIAFKILFSSLRKLKRWRSQQSSLPSASYPTPPHHQSAEETLWQSQLMLEILTVHTMSSCRSSVTQTSPNLCVPQFEEDRPGRSLFTRARDLSFLHGRGRMQGEVRNNSQTAVQHQGWIRDVLVLNLATVLTAKPSRKGKDFRVKL